jgi:hypothetical protein
MNMKLKLIELIDNDLYLDLFLCLALISLTFIFSIINPTRIKIKPIRYLISFFWVFFLL